ncbi:MAG: hypothetical protein BHV69_03915 [Bacteroidales bacterium 52_46]|nr:MAG: hypothetical protein BHV69_03915 [Bacteroidales bacterium 52_46]
MPELHLVVSVLNDTQIIFAFVALRSNILLTLMSGRIQTVRDNFEKSEEHFDRQTTMLFTFILFQYYIM